MRGVLYTIPVFVASLASGCAFADHTTLSVPVSTGYPQERIDKTEGYIELEYQDAIVGASIDETRRSSVIVVGTVPIPAPSSGSGRPGTRITVRVKPKTSGITLNPERIALVVNKGAALAPIRCVQMEGVPNDSRRGVPDCTTRIQCEGVSSIHLHYATAYNPEDRYTLSIEGLQKDTIPLDVHKIDFTRSGKIEHWER